MKKIQFFILIIISIIISCSQPYNHNIFDVIEDKYSLTNECSFSIATGTETVSNTWQSASNTIGFINSSYGYYFNIFKASYGYQSDETFYDYIFIAIKEKTIGSYSSDDGKTDVSLYDDHGNLFMVFDNDDGATYVDIVITDWTNNFITGTFSGRLMNYPSYTYWGIEGSFTSFDSSNRNITSKVVIDFSSRNTEMNKILKNKIRVQEEFDSYKTKN